MKNDLQQKKTMWNVSKTVEKREKRKELKEGNMKRKGRAEGTKERYLK